MEGMSFAIYPSSSLLQYRVNLAFVIPTIRPRFPTPGVKIPKPARTRPAGAGFRVCNSKENPAAGAARDRVIDFGKYSGRMLGTLPSSYLKWISDNLRSGDTEEWARLSDQVLRDPVYRDRIEWEVAERVLNGGSRGSTGDGSNAAEELLEISERFGWDYEDKAGWSRVNFGLLGTTGGGRIPRVGNGGVNGGEGKAGREIRSVSDGDGGRRRERRARARRRREEKASDGGIENKVEMMNDDEEDEGGDDGGVSLKNRFPGREALLNKVLNRQWR